MLRRRRDAGGRNAPCPSRGMTATPTAVAGRASGLIAPSAGNEAGEPAGSSAGSPAAGDDASGADSGAWRSPCAGRLCRGVRKTRLAGGGAGGGVDGVVVNDCGDIDGDGGVDGIGDGSVDGIGEGGVDGVDSIGSLVSLPAADRHDAIVAPAVAARERPSAGAPGGSTPFSRTPLAGTPPAGTSATAPAAPGWQAALPSLSGLRQTGHVPWQSRSQGTRHASWRMCRQCGSRLRVGTRAGSGACRDRAWRRSHAAGRRSVVAGRTVLAGHRRGPRGIWRKAPVRRARGRARGWRGRTHLPVVPHAQASQSRRWPPAAARALPRPMPPGQAAMARPAEGRRHDGYGGVRGSAAQLRT